jgi:hypothetical protein
MPDTTAPPVPVKFGGRRARDIQMGSGTEITCTAQAAVDAGTSMGRDAGGNGDRSRSHRRDRGVRGDARGDNGRVVAAPAPLLKPTAASRTRTAPNLF